MVVRVALAVGMLVILRVDVFARKEDVKRGVNPLAE
jgi:hypothetical protein